MKNLFLSLLIVTVFGSCQKRNDVSSQQNQTTVPNQEGFGPYGKESKWKSIAGDTLYEEKLTLSYFYTEKNIPCNICYYQQNYSLWNDYDYTLSITECTVVGDTLTLIDIDTNKKAIFKREN